MEKPELEKIVKEIKDKGLTAYQISKDLPISEVGINKILNGESKKPQKSTLLLLHNYLFNKVEPEQEKTPQQDVRFEDIVAEKVLQKIGPLLNGNTEKLLKAVMNLQTQMDLITANQEETQETVENAKGTLEIIEKRLP